MAYIGQAPANKPVEGSDISATVITGQTELSSAPADTDEFLISDAGTLKRLDASLVGGGKVNQVIQTVKSDTFSSSSGSFTDITGMSATITPTASDSKVLVMVNINVASTYRDRWVALQLLRGSTNIYLGDASSSRTRASSFYVFFDATGKDTNIYEKTMIFLDSPSTTSATTYKLQGKTQTDDSPSFVVNRSGGDTDAVYGGRTASSITLMEIKA
tara:strand:+ start:282 stop:929 length:648 start_codon:yes stop_codon:yes gene_type:complete